MIDAMIDEIEREHCVCGAELDRNKPRTWQHCGIHERCQKLREHFVAALEDRQEAAPEIAEAFEKAAVRVETAHFEGWISDSISGLPLDRSQCNSPNAPTYIHRETENCWGAYVAGEASGRRWKIAIEEACIVNHINFFPEDAQKSLSNLITWETKIALDPKVSKEAADLFASGRRSALTDFEKWAESQRSGLDEEHKGKVIDWCEKLLNP